MRTMTVSAPGSQFERVQHRFDLWRKTRKRCSPIPETLWSSAVELAREHGLHRTARALRLNYYSLKKRFPVIAGAPCRPQREATFVELLPPGAAGPSACTIEMENAQGGKMKIHVQGLGGPDRGSERQLLEGRVMIQIVPQMRILVAVQPIDFRNGIDGLARICKQALEADAFSGCLFVFRNRRRTAIKILAYDSRGFWLCQKRLSTGRFRFWPESTSEAAKVLEAHELQVLLAGGDPGAAQAMPAWRRIA